MRVRVLLLCALLCLAFFGCTQAKGDYFAPFQGAFCAQIEGTWRAVDFSAQLAVSAPDQRGEREMTLTFYAPSTLVGTTLRRDPTGALTLCTDGLSLPLTATAAKGYGALFSLFPTEGEVREVTHENGNTRVCGEGFCLTLAPDGTPLAASNDAARVQVTAWE